MKPIFVEPQMNKTEARFAEFLQTKKLEKSIVDWRFEAVRLILANNTSYTPDFFVIYKDRFVFFEVKGFWREDARVKIKVAARMFPWFNFIAVQWENREWVYEEIKP